MNDVEFKLMLLFDDDVSNETIKEISYIVNKACSKIEEFKCAVTYRVKVNGSSVVIKD